MKEMCSAILSSLHVVFKTLTIEYAEVNADRLNQWCIQELNRSMVIAAVIIQNYMRKYIANVKLKSQLRLTMNAALEKLKGMISDKQSCLPAVMFGDICDKLSSLQQPSESSLVTGNILSVPSDIVGSRSIFSMATSSSSVKSYGLPNRLLLENNCNDYFPTAFYSGDNKILRMKNQLMAISKQLSSRDFDTSQVSSWPFELSSVITEGGEQEQEQEVIPTGSGFGDSKGGKDRSSSSKGTAERLRAVVQRWRLNNSSTTSDASQDSSNRHYPKVSMGPNKWKRISHSKGGGHGQRLLREVTFPESNEVEVVDFSRISIIPPCRMVDSSTSNNAVPITVDETQTENHELLRQDKCATVIQKFFRRRYRREEYAVPFYSAHSTASDHSLVSVPPTPTADDISELGGSDGDADHLLNQHFSIDLSDEELYSSEQILLEAEEAFQSEWDPQGDNDLNLNSYAIKIQTLYRKYRDMAAYREIMSSCNKSMSAAAATINRNIRRYVATLRVSRLRHECLVAEILAACVDRRELLLVQKQIAEIKRRKMKDPSPSPSLYSPSRPNTPRSSSSSTPSNRHSRRRLTTAAVTISRNVRRFIASKFVNRLREERLVMQVLMSCSVRRELLLVQRHIARLHSRKG